MHTTTFAHDALAGTIERERKLHTVLFVQQAARATQMDFLWAPRVNLLAMLSALSGLVSLPARPTHQLAM